jgi:ATP-binding cassette subfamily B protein
VVSLSLMFSLDCDSPSSSCCRSDSVSITVKMFGTAIHKTFEEVQEKLSDMSAVVQESLTGVRVVRAYGQERAEIARFRVSNIDYLRHNKRLSRLQGAFFRRWSLFLGISALLALWLGSRYVTRGRLTVGQLVAFNAYPRAAGVADDRIRLGYEPARARHGVVEADADRDECEPGNTR